MRVVLAIAALSLAACGDGPTWPDLAGGTPFGLRAGHTAILPDGLRLRFDRVQADSRCPLDAICVSAGDATIAVSFISRNGNADSRELHTQPGGSQISYGSYTIALTELQPYPRSTQQTKPEDYVATFVVRVR
jgi:hypothetical protein